MMVSKPPTEAPEGEPVAAEARSDGCAGALDDTAFDRLLLEAAKLPSLGRVIAPGTRLAEGRFEILRRIGEGGMGVVYEAFDAARKEKVALKTMSRLDASEVYRLKNEFRSLAEVSHPNLVGLHELCADGELWCFTMELVAGERFDRWVRPRGGSDDLNAKGTPDEARLRSALPQLVEAVAAIHAAGKLHRDLKPSNVLVTGEGRVVVLDFGLAIDPDAGGVGQTVTDANVSGTPAYMAPEQAAGQTATTASDFYALGVMLFEALTGRLPFEGSAAEMLVDKQRTAAPRPSRLEPAAPADLDALCAQLMSREPSMRPDAAALRARLPPSEERSTSSGSDSSGRSGTDGRRVSHAPEAAPELFGRQAELAALGDAFDATLAGQAVVVFVRGESGIGKSALCETFLHGLRAQGRAMVLSGRCYERENVPFKGFDSLVDDLSRHLRRLPREEAIAVLPREVHALTRLFPVLGRVEVVADAPRKEIPDPLELRRRAYAAFGELLARMCDRAPLCVHLDDVQWLDSDAVLFMRALMVHPEPVPALIVLSHRSEGADTNEALLQVRDAVEGNSRLALRTLAVQPLAREAARDLSLRLLPPSAAAEVTANAIARESLGSPFFVGELCRFVSRHGGDVDACARMSLSAALGDHVNALPDAARRLLEHSALAGKPLPASILLNASHAAHTELDRLRSAHLLRVSRIEDSPIVECYHDKVREVVARGLSELTRVSCYASLAGALEAAEHADLELLAVCLEGAGQLEAAAEQSARAAHHATAGTAFLHAAALYDKALALGRFAPERTHALRVAQAEALASAGRGKQAAEVFQRAAEGAQGAERRVLMRRAAEELLNTGYTDEGMAQFRALFSELGLTLPANARAALPRLLVSHLRLKLRGIDYVPRDPSACAPETLQALDLLRASAMGLSMNASPLLAASVNNDYALRALQSGISEHVATALTGQAYFLSFSEPSATARLERMTSEALRLGAEISDAGVRAGIEVAVANTWINCGQWKRGREHHARSVELMRGQPKIDQAALDSAEFYSQLADYWSGDWLRPANVAPQLIEQGYSRERIWIAVVLSYCGMMSWFSKDDPAGYERVLERAKTSWHRGAEAQWPDFFICFGEVLCHLYRGQADRALPVLEESRVWLSRSLVRRAQLADMFTLQIQGMAALAALRAGGDRDLIRVVRDSAKRLTRNQLAVAAAVRAPLEAGLALHAGDLLLGARHLRSAIAAFDACETSMYAAAARRRLGELLGGDEGKALLAESDAVMRAQRIVNLDAVTEMLCAGCRAP